MLSEDVEYIDTEDADDEDPFLIESKDAMDSQFLVYEEK